MLSCTPAYALPGHRPTHTSGVIWPLSPDRLNVLKLVVDAKQPNRAKVPIVAGSRLGTRLSTGEGEDDTGEVVETPPGEPLEEAGTEGEDGIGGLPDVGPEGFPDVGPDGFPDAGPEGPAELAGSEDMGMGLLFEAGVEAPAEVADSEGGDAGVPTEPEAELSAELGEPGVVAIGVGTELSGVGVPLEPGEVPPGPTVTSVVLEGDAMSVLAGVVSLDGRLDEELDGETWARL